MRKTFACWVSELIPGGGDPVIDNGKHVGKDECSKRTSSILKTRKLIKVCVNSTVMERYQL